MMNEVDLYFQCGKISIQCKVNSYATEYLFKLWVKYASILKYIFLMVLMMMLHHSENCIESLLRVFFLMKFFTKTIFKYLS